MISARTKQVDWIFDYGTDGQLTRWPDDVDIMGAALSRSAVAEDGVFDLVGWEDINPLRLHAVRLSSDEDHTVSFDTFRINFDGRRPTAGSVLAVMGEQRLLLLVNQILYLIDPTNKTSPVVAEYSFGFTPRFFVTPNWGTEDQPIVLGFDPDTGDYACLSFDTSGLFLPCEL